MSNIETENQINDEAAMKRYFTSSSFRLLTIWVSSLVIETVLPIIIALFASKITIFDKYYYEISMFLSLLIDVFLFGILNLAMINHEKSKPEKKSISFGKLALILWCGYIASSIFSIIGNYANESMLAPFGYDLTDTNVSLEMMMSFSGFKGFALEIIFFGILGPLMEELIFRKTIIDNFSKYGMGAAIIVSSVTFGLFHGNISQCFMAMVLGAVFAYVYSLSGKIIYSAIMHMTINIYNIVTVMITYVFLKEETLQKMDEFFLEFSQTNDINAYTNAITTYFSDKPEQLLFVLLSGFMNFVFDAVWVVGFFVLLFNIRRFIRFRRTLNLGEKGAKTYAMLNIGMVFCYICAFLTFAYNFAIDVLNSPLVESILLKK